MFFISVDKSSKIQQKVWTQYFPLSNPINIGVRGGGGGGAAAPPGLKIFRASAIVAQKSWMIKKTFQYSEKFQGNCFSGQAQVLKYPEW